MYTHDSQPLYHAYLLRCWREQSLERNGAATWRFSLENPHTSERRGFATWEALIAFLHEELWEEACSAQGGAAND